MNFGSILTAAWRATWKHRAMWVLGMAILGYTGSVGFQAGNSFIPADTTSTNYETQQMYDLFGDIWTDYWFLFLLLGLCILLLALVAYVFHFVAVAGIYQGAAWAAQGKSVQFWPMCRAGMRYLLPVFGLTVIFGLAISLPLALLIGVIIVLFLSIIGIIVAIPLLLLFCVAMLPLAWVSMTLYSFAVQELVLHDTGISRSLTLAWRAFKQNWLTTLLAYASVVGWQFGSGLVLVFALGLVGLPLVFFGYLAYTAEAWLIILLVLMLGLSCVAVIVLLIKGISQSFSAHLWHGVYRACRDHHAALAQR